MGPATVLLTRGHEVELRQGATLDVVFDRPVTLGVIVEHVSDTARIVAAHRALETQRADGLIRDPFAALLAGDKGMAIACSDTIAEDVSLRIGLRDRFVDDLLLGVIEREGPETIVNLGAGLDTRPWRLNLPARLRWIEVDFKEMLEYKAEKLCSERPRCLLEQITADVSIPSDRKRLFDAIGDRPALIITEMLLMYLPKQTLEALSSEMSRRRQCAGGFWTSYQENQDS